jgi:tetratricopeptide (TPR) repeat protein
MSVDWRLARQAWLTGGIVGATHVGTDLELQRQIEYFEGKYGLSPQSRVFAPLADLYRRDGRTEDALQLLQEGLEQHPEYISALVVLGRTYDAAEDTDAARAAWQRVISADPENLVALRRLAEDADERGSWRTAVTLWERYVTLEPQDESAEESLRCAREALATQAEPSATPNADDGADVDATDGEAEVIDAATSAEVAPEIEPAPNERDKQKQEKQDRKRPAIAWGGPIDPLTASTVEETVRAVEEVPVMDAAPAVKEDGAGDGPTVADATTEPAAKSSAATTEARPYATLRGLATRTLADIYLAQGYRDKALAVLQEILARDPGRDDVRDRLHEIENSEVESPITARPDRETGDPESGDKSGASVGTEDRPTGKESASAPRPPGGPRRRAAERTAEFDQFSDWLARIRPRQQKSDS